MCVGNPMSLIDQGKEVPCPGPCVYKGPFKLFLACALSRGKELDPLQCISPVPGRLECWDFQFRGPQTHFQAFYPCFSSQGWTLLPRYTYLFPTGGRWIANYCGHKRHGWDMLGAVSTQGTSVCVLELMVGGKGEWTARLFARERGLGTSFSCAIKFCTKLQGIQKF